LINFLKFLHRQDLEEEINQKNIELERFRQNMHEYEDEIVSLKRKSSTMLEKQRLPKNENEGNNKILAILQEEM